MTADHGGRPTEAAETTDRPETPDADRPTMRDVSHTPPYDDPITGIMMFSRGRVLATDGGDPGRPAADATMADVDHTPPDGTGAKRVWDRGLPKPGVHVAGDR